MSLFPPHRLFNDLQDQTEKECEISSRTTMPIEKFVYFLFQVFHSVYTYLQSNLASTSDAFAEIYGTRMQNIRPFEIFRCGALISSKSLLQTNTLLQNCICGSLELLECFLRNRTPLYVFSFYI